MRAAIKNQLVMCGGMVAAEVDPIRPGWRTWFAIHSVPTSHILNPARPTGTLHIPGLDITKVSPAEKFIYTLKRGSVDEETLRQGWDPSGSAIIDQFQIAYSYLELERALAEVAVDPELFREAWNSDYPL